MSMLEHATAVDGFLFKHYGVDVRRKLSVKSVRRTLSLVIYRYRP